jgi:hypothetical protein
MILVNDSLFFRLLGGDEYSPDNKSVFQEGTKLNHFCTAHQKSIEPLDKA